MIKSVLTYFFFYFSLTSYCQIVEEHFDVADERKKKFEETNEIASNFKLGLAIRINVPKIHVTQQFISSNPEPTNYDSEIGISFGVKGEFLIWNNLFLSGGLFFQEQKYSRQKIIINTDAFIFEKLNYLNTPFQFGYQFLKPDFQFFVNGGLSIYYLLSTKADLEFGRNKTTNYDMSDQRNTTTYYFIFGGGIRKKFGLTALELSANYELGLNNFVIAEKKYSDPDLVLIYAYVPDDFTMNHIRITVGVVYSLGNPNKNNK